MGVFLDGARVPASAPPYHLLTKYAASAAHVLFIPEENDSKSRRG